MKAIFDTSFYRKPFFSPIFGAFLISTLILPYFCKNRDLFVDGTPNQGLLNDPPDDYCIIPSTCYPFHLLFFCPIVFKRHFWHPGQWFDGTPNLGSSFWMIHYDLLPVTCQLPPATWYLRHLWRQKQVADKCEVYALLSLLLEIFKKGKGILNWFKLIVDI